MHKSTQCRSDVASSIGMSPSPPSSRPQYTWKVSSDPIHPPAGVYRVPFEAGQARGDAVAVTHVLVVCEADVYWVRVPGCDSELAGLVTGLVCPVDVYWVRVLDCDSELAGLVTGLVCLVDVYWVKEPGCDSELAGLDAGLVCPVDVDVDVEKDAGCDAEVGELETELDSWADVAVVSAVPLGLTVTLEEEDENV
jgi:hypothetical protein